MVKVFYKITPRLACCLKFPRICTRATLLLQKMYNKNALCNMQGQDNENAQVSNNHKMELSTKYVYLP